MAKHTFRNRLGELTETPEFSTAQAEDAVGETLDALSTSFDDLLERLQTPAARQGMEAAFNASPAELGQAAVEAARRRR